MTRPGSIARLARRLELPLVMGRAAAGLVLITVPATASRAWLGMRSRKDRRFARALGVRDLVICIGQLRSRGDAAGSWRRIAAAADLFDAIVSFGGAVAGRRALTAVMAVPAIASTALHVAPREPHTA